MKYYEYWELDKRPFDNVPDPTMYFDGNSTLDDAVVEILFGIEESEDCLIVLVGDIGLGKTLSLRLVLDGLDTEKYSVVFINNTSMSFNQLLREIVGQITGEVCKTRSRDQILEEFNSLLFAEAEKNRRVLIFIDEANVLKPTDLQDLRLLTTMQADDQNLFTLILAGQPILAKRLESHTMQNLTQRIGVYCELEALSNCEVMEHYIDTRLQRAGAKSTIFSEDAIWEIWHTTNGIPRLINRLCNLCLKAGQTHELEMIDGTIVKLVSQRLPEAKSSFTTLTDKSTKNKKTPKVLRKRKTNNKKKLEEMADIDVSTFSSMPEETQKLVGKLAAESLRREGKSPGTAMAEWNRLRNHIAHEYLDI